MSIDGTTLLSLQLVRLSTHTRLQRQAAPHGGLQAVFECGSPQRSISVLVATAQVIAGRPNVAILLFASAPGGAGPFEV